MKRNIAEKLKNRGISTSTSEEFLADIFGKHTGTTYEEGLVDSKQESDFDIRLDRCREIWLARERPFVREGQLSFFDYFNKYYANVVRHSMLKDMRISAGLGNPPSIFTTNSSESINAVVKRKVHFKETEWPQFNQELKKIVNEMHQECIRAISGRGEYKLCKSYQHLQVDPSKWSKMTPQQRQEHVRRFQSAALRSLPNDNRPFSNQPSLLCSSDSSANVSTSISCENEASTSSKGVSVTADKSGIQNLSFETVHSIWAKAEDYLISKTDIVPAPGVNKSMMVASKSSKVPHFVCAGSNGKYTCDNNCLQWKSSGICSHIISVAEKNCELSAFLQWYNGTNQEPNITTLAMSGLPAGRGRKGGVPKRKRSTGSKKTPEIVVSRFAMQPTHHVLVSVEPAVAVSIQPTPPSPMTASPLPVMSQDRRNMDPSVEPTLFDSGSSPNIHAVGSIVSVSSNVARSIVSSNNNLILQSPVASCTSACNTNPFFVRFIVGNIRVCQGCRSSLRSADGSVPKAPFDLAIARFERRPYRDKTGELKTPTRDQAAHYHLKVGCVQSGSPSFVSTSLFVPPDVYILLTQTHKEYLRLMFGIQFN